MKAHSKLTHTRRRLSAAASVVVAGALLVAPGVTQSANAGGRYTPSGPTCGTTIYKADGSKWTCTFDDEFSSRTLDSSKWGIGTTAATGFYMGDTCMTSDNVAVVNGSLRLGVRNAPAGSTCSSPYGPVATHYTGSHVGTYGKFAQTYGRFEVRSRFPNAGSGLHGGWWIYPASLTYGAWPASGEIDATEWWSSVPTAMLPTLHYNGSTFVEDTGWNCTVVDPYAWHTYGLVWTPSQMEFSIDGTACFTRTWTPAAPQIAPQPFDKPFNFVLNLAVDDTSDNPVLPNTTFPATYEVDYVKAWK